MKKLAFIDLDNCLATCNLSEVLLHLLIKQNALEALDRPIPLLLREFEQRQPKPTLAEIFKLAYSFCKGIKVDLIDQLSQQIIDRGLSNFLRPSMLSILKWHQVEDNEVILLSCSTEHVVQKAAQALKIDRAFGLVQEEVHGICTGKISGIYCGKKKAEKMTELSHQLHLPLKEAFFYSDAYDDAAAFQLVGHPIAAFPDADLKALAKERGWMIIDKSSNISSLLPEEAL